MPAEPATSLQTHTLGPARSGGRPGGQSEPQGMLSAEPSMPDQDGANCPTASSAVHLLLLRLLLHKASACALLALQYQTAWTRVLASSGTMNKKVYAFLLIITCALKHDQKQPIVGCAPS